MFSRNLCSVPVRDVSRSVSYKSEYESFLERLDMLGHPVQRAIGRFCAKHPGRLYLPSEMYRSSKAVRDAVDEQIKESKRLTWQNIKNPPVGITKVVFKTTSNRFEEVFSPSKCVWRHCQKMQSLGIGAIKGSRFGIFTYLSELWTFQG